MRLPALLSAPLRLPGSSLGSWGDALPAAFARLSPRERTLLAGLVGLGLPLALLVFWVLPLLAGLDSARAELAQARDTRLWLQDRAAEARALGTPPPAEGAAPLAPIGISGVEQSLIRAGLRPLVTELANSTAAEGGNTGADAAGGDNAAPDNAGGGIDLGFDTVPFAALTGWLDAAVEGSGYAVAAFRFEARPEPGLITAQIRLEPAR